MQQKAISDWRKNSANLFVLNMLIIYAVWKAFSYYVKNSAGSVHTTWDKMIDALGSAYASATSFILNGFGEYTSHMGITVIYPLLNKTIRVEDHCLGLPATVIFIGTIILFKGNNKDKLWFIPMGILLIAVINLTRLVFLCYTFAHFSKAFFDINHSIVYVVVTYALIFLLIVWWMKKFATKN